MIDKRALLVDIRAVLLNETAIAQAGFLGDNQSVEEADRRRARFRAWVGERAGQLGQVVIGAAHVPAVQEKPDHCTVQQRAPCGHWHACGRPVAVTKGVNGYCAEHAGRGK